MKWMYIIMLMSWGATGWSQTTAELKRQAREFYATGRYEDARTILLGSRELSRTDKEGRFLLALCHYQLHQLNESLTLLKTLTEEEKTAYPECWFYLGKIYHARHQFQDAAGYYKTYLNHTTAGGDIRSRVADLIRCCLNGQQLQYQAPKAVEENLGPQVNTQYDEFAPVLSPTVANRLYFSSIRAGNAGGKRNPNGIADERNGQYFSDLFFCSNIGGTWSRVQPMPYQINSPRHEVLLDFNKEGNALIYFKGLDLKKGEIVVDTFRPSDQRLMSSDPLPAPIRPLEGDEAPYFYNDTLIVFASSRPGGSGGLDLYKTAYRNGTWTEPENLGSDVNSAYNETTPFLSRDGNTLYFSSDNPERSIGGLDVFKTTYVNAVQRWTEPKNLGLPVNSAGDDAHFRLAPDGFTAFFSSDRKDGFGQRDLYMAIFKDYLLEQEEPAVVDLSISKPPSPQAHSNGMEQAKLQESVGTPTTPAPLVPSNLIYFNDENELWNLKNQRRLDEMGMEVADAAERKLCSRCMRSKRLPCRRVCIRQF